MLRLLRTYDNFSTALQILLKGGQVRRKTASTFSVRSQSENNRDYQVRWIGKRWSCNCKPEKENNAKAHCTHIDAIVLLASLPQILSSNVDPDSMQCPKCGSSLEHASPTGIQRNKSGMVQRYTCGRCRYRFNDRNGFGRLKSNPALVIVAVDLHLRGLSTREIGRHLHEVYGSSVNHTTVFRWTARYLKILARIEQKLVASGKILVGDRWLADEAMTKIRGKRAYIWSILDYRTRYLLATLVSNSRGSGAAEKVMRLAVERFGKVPKRMVTDGLASYVKPIKNLGNKYIDTVSAPFHVAGKTFHDKVNNNRIERFNRTLRRRVRVADKFEEISSANDFVAGFGAYYNLLRPSLGLDYKSPANKANLKVSISLAQILRKGDSMKND